MNLFGWDMTIYDKPQAPKEPPMKKRKIREMLQAILDKLDAKDTSGDATLLKVQLGAANKRAEEVAKKAAQACELEDQLRFKTKEVTHLKQRLEETEKDRDAWKRECNAYQNAFNAGGREE